MTPAARIAAAIEVLAAIETQRRPAHDAMREWGIAHRFAGSKDRSAISALVHDALRVRASASWIMGEATPRAVMLGALRRARGMDAEGIAALCDGVGHSPAPLTGDEAARLVADDLTGAPDHVRGDYPEWLAPSFEAVFGEDSVSEGRALAERAPVDLRANALKITREKALDELSHLGAEPTKLSPLGLRIAIGADGRGPALQAEPAYVRGLVEVQDEGSQIAALLAAAKPGMQVLDLCAGGGGKTLAIAGGMDASGQIYSADSDGRRLMPIFARLERAGVRNVQVRAPKGKLPPALNDIKGRCDIVFVDAPCTGTGTWRRNPDAKWRTRPGALEQRIKEQDQVLDDAVQFVKAGGTIVYVTCSLLREEDEDRVAAFLNRHPDFLPIEAAHMARRAELPQLAEYGSKLGPGIRLTPRSAGTDGFYVCVLLKQ